MFNLIFLHRAHNTFFSTLSFSTFFPLAPPPDLLTPNNFIFMQDLSASVSYGTHVIVAASQILSPLPCHYCYYCSRCLYCLLRRLCRHCSLLVSSLLASRCRSHRVGRTRAVSSLASCHDCSRRIFVARVASARTAVVVTVTYLLRCHGCLVLCCRHCTNEKNWSWFVRIKN